MTDYARTLKTDPIISVNTRVLYTEQAIPFFEDLLSTAKNGVYIVSDVTLGELGDDEWNAPYTLVSDTGSVGAADYSELETFL